MRTFGKPSPAMVVACIALAIALTGASYAAVSLPRNSVGTKALKNNAVTSGKIKNKTIKTADLSKGARVPQLFARVDGTGVLFGDANESSGITAAMIQHDAIAGAETTGPGVYCFKLPYQARSAMVVPDSAMSGATVVASVALLRSGAGLGGCDADHQFVRVTLTQVNDTAPPVNVDHRFFVWFLK